MGVLANGLNGHLGAENADRGVRQVVPREAITGLRATEGGPSVSTILSVAGFCVSINGSTRMILVLGWDAALPLRGHPGLTLRPQVLAAEPDSSAGRRTFNRRGRPAPPRATPPSSRSTGRRITRSASSQRVHDPVWLTVEGARSPRPGVLTSSVSAYASCTADVEPRARPRGVSRWRW